MNNHSPTPKQFYRAFPASASVGVDEDKYYVNRFEQDAEDIVQEITQQIEWDQDTACYLFTGLRGAGKTTELNRLKNELDQQGTPVFYMDASDYLNLNDPELDQSVLIFTVLAGLGDAIKREYGEDLLQESVWERFKTLLNTEVSLSKVKLPLPGTKAGVEFSLSDNAAFKSELIKFARQSNDYYQQATAFMAYLKQVVKDKTGQEQLVLIVDSLERLSAPQGSEETLFNSLKDVFFNNPARMYFPECILLYTVPPYMHALLPDVSAHYTRTFSLNNFKVMFGPHTDKPGKPNAQVLQKVQDVVTKRFKEWECFMSPDVLQHFAYLSGGNMRRLFSLLRHFISKANLLKTAFPVTAQDDNAVKQAINEEINPLLWLNAKDRKWLAWCDLHGGDLAQKINELQEDLPSIIRLFDNSLILNYKNGQPWYQILPLLKGNIELTDYAQSDDV